MSLYLAGEGRNCIKVFKIGSTRPWPELAGEKIVIFRQRKVGPDKTSRLLVDENDWDNCRPCSDHDKVTTTSRETGEFSHNINCLCRILISSVLPAALLEKGHISTRQSIYQTIKVVERLELINELSEAWSPGKIIDLLARQRYLVFSEVDVPWMCGIIRFLYF